MAIPIKDLKKFFLAPGSRRIWPVLILFFVGSAICAFNPPAGDRQQSVKEVQVMDNTYDQHLSETTDLKTGAMPAGFETATFALG